MAKKEKDEGSAPARWEPFRDLDAWAGFRPGQDWDLGTPRLSRMMEELFGARPRAAGLAPALDVVEDDKSYIVSVELPGAKKEDVNVECHDNVLTIRGEKRSEREEKKEQRRWTERTYGSFSRSFTLPSDTDPERVQASFKDGVLTVTLSKSQEAKPRVVHIKS
jgi:HSP20 family protein